MYIIAADVGGTKTHFMLASRQDPHKVLYEARYQSGAFDGFTPLLQKFLDDSGVHTGHLDSLTLALPGLVNETSATLTNLPWTIEKRFLQDHFGIRQVSFMNDFQASALGIDRLREQDRIILNAGLNASNALQDNAVRVAVGAGTGLGVAWLQGNGEAARSYDTEGGHIDFAPVDDVQMRLLQFLQKRHQHVSYERILSGNGLVSLYEFCSGTQRGDVDAAWVNAQAKSNEDADHALSLFVQIYGAYIGNIALLFKPYGGIFITGGVAAKMLHKMQSDEFIRAYLNKGRMSALVEQVPVYLVVNESIGVLGAMSETLQLQRELQ